MSHLAGVRNLLRFPHARATLPYTCEARRFVHRAEVELGSPVASQHFERSLTLLPRGVRLGATTWKCSVTGQSIRSSKVAAAIFLCSQLVRQHSTPRETMEAVLLRGSPDPSESEAAASTRRGICGQRCTRIQAVHRAVRRRGSVSALEATARVHPTLLSAARPPAVCLPSIPRANTSFSLQVWPFLQQHGLQVFGN